MTTVLICEDDEPLRDELARTVAQVPGVDRVETAATGAEVLARFASERPRLVLIDAQMPGMDGVETTTRLLAEHPEANVVMLTDENDGELAARAIEGGARGYLAKGMVPQQVSAAVAGALAFAELAVRPALTEREIQVLRGMAEGKSNAEIGRQLYLSEDTVKTHARRLFRKLEVRDRAQAVALGFRLGLVR